MSGNMQQLVSELYKPFSLDEHEIRIGSFKNKAQWFVYVRREAITARLDKLFPLDWSNEIINITQHENHATATMRLTLGGISRENNGSQQGSDIKAEKGAVTDAFKRTASVFGIGLYLQSTPKLYTDGGFSSDGKRVTDWNKHNSQSKEALNKFAAWYKTGNAQGDTQQKGNNGNAPPQAQAETTVEMIWTEERTNNFIQHWDKQGLTLTELLRFADVSNKSPEVWENKYVTPKSASAAIQSAWDKELEATPQTTPKTEPALDAIFKYMSYVGSKCILQFMTNEPGSDNNTCALLFEGRGGITSMYGNDELYKQLELSQYDKIKGKNVVSDFVKMKIDVGFYFENVIPKNNNEPYFKITGIKGDPVIPF